MSLFWQNALFRIWTLQATSKREAFFDSAIRKLLSTKWSNVSHLRKILTWYLIQLYLFKRWTYTDILQEAMLDCSNCSKQLFYVTTRDICVSTFFLIQSQLSACCLISASNNYLTKGFRFQPFTVTSIF